MTTIINGMGDVLACSADPGRSDLDDVDQLVEAGEIAAITGYDRQRVRKRYRGNE